MNSNKFKKRLLIVSGTVIGLVALFLIIVFIPIGSNKIDIIETSVENDLVAENQKIDVDELSVGELKEKVKELETENMELKDEVEKYKILAENATQGVPEYAAPNNSTKKNNDNVSTKTEKTEYKDSSEYYDEEYTKYTNDPPVSDDEYSDNDKKNGESENEKNTSSETSGSDVNKSPESAPSETPADTTPSTGNGSINHNNTSDTGL